jgi:hypothetical protein
VYKGAALMVSPVEEASNGPVSGRIPLPLQHVLLQQVLLLWGLLEDYGDSHIVQALPTTVSMH